MNADELPVGWERRTLAEIGEVRLGRQRSPKNHEGPRMRPYLRAANVTWNGLDLTDVKEMNFSEAESETYELRDGDILVSEASGSPGEVGKPAIWRNEIPGACFQNTLLRVRLRDADPEFVRYRLLFEARRGGFATGSRGIGIHHLGKKALSEWPIEVPPLDEQRRIVSEIERRFSNLDAGVNDLQRIAIKLQLARAAVFGLLAPDGVPWCDVDDVAEVRGGIQKQPKRRPVKNAYPYLRVANVGRGRLDLADVHKIELFDGEIDRYRLHEGDLLVVEGNGSPREIGRAAPWDGSISDCVHQNHLIRVRAGESLCPDYLALVWNSPQVASAIAGVASSTSGLHTLSTAKVKGIKIPFPTLKEQRQLVAEVRRRLSLLESVGRAVEDNVRRASAVRRSIMQRAFSGALVPKSFDVREAVVLVP